MFLRWVLCLSRTGYVGGMKRRKLTKTEMWQVDEIAKVIVGVMIELKFTDAQCVAAMPS